MKTRTKRMIIRPLALLLALLTVTGSMLIIPLFGLNGSAAGQVSAKNPQVEYMTTPLGIDEKKPHFSYYLEASGDLRGVIQESYRIVVSAKSDLSSPVWDSGTVSSAQTFAIEYAGGELAARTRYYWTATSKTNKGDASVSSWFETGLMSTSVSAWDGATWIGAPGSSTPDVDNYTIEYDFKINKHASAFCFAGEGSAFLAWQFNTTDGFANTFRPHKFGYNGDSTLTNNIDISSVLTRNASTKGTDDWYRCKIVVTKSGTTYYATTSLGKIVSGAFTLTVIDSNRALPTGHNWSLGKVGFRQHQSSDDQEDASYDNIKITDNSKSAVVFDVNFEDGKIPDMWGTKGAIEKVGTNNTYRVPANTTFMGSYRVVDSAAESGDPLLRKTFTVPASDFSKIASARVYATARGYYEMRLNGGKVGDQYLAPGDNDYNYNLMYQTYDVMGQIKSGDNVIGAFLDRGWYDSPFAQNAGPFYGDDIALLALLVVTYNDGTKLTIKTDNSWQYARGPVIYADNYTGEYYDARADKKGWDNVGYNAAGWTAAATANALKGGVSIIAQIGEPVRQVATFKNPTLTEPMTGRFTYDFGQNFSGFARITVKGTVGQKITLQFAEMLNTDVAYMTSDGKSIGGGDGPIGTIYYANLRGTSRGRQIGRDEYTFKGDASGEAWEPRFTFHGFRYVEITGAGLTRDQIVSIEGIAISSDNATTGTFQTNNEKLNQLYSNIVWGMYGNFVSIPTDCPQRDERLGWTADTQVFTGTGVYLAQNYEFYRKWLTDLFDWSDDHNGQVPDTIPSYFGGWSNGWSDAAIVVPYQLYMQYGDKRILEEFWDSMVKYMNYVWNNQMSGNIRKDGNGYGDWLSVEPNDNQLTNTLYVAYDYLLMKQMAKALGKSTATFSNRVNTIMDAVNTKWGDGAGSLKVSNQTPLALMLYFGLADNNKDLFNSAKIAEMLAENIKNHGWKLTTGFIGVNALLPALSKYGQMYAAVKLLEQEEYPSWLYSVNQGATTIWERWNSFTVANGFGDVGMNSFNHYAYGSVGEWLYSGVLGIERDNAAPGFTHFNLNPQFGASVTYAKGSYESVSGLICSEWVYNAAAKSFTYTVTVPANATATLYMPTTGGAITESGKAASSAEGVTYVKTEGGRAIYELKSGTYTFVSQVTDSDPYHDIGAAIANSATVKDAYPIIKATVDGQSKTSVGALVVETGKSVTYNVGLANTVDFVIDSVKDKSGNTVSPSGSYAKLNSDLKHNLTISKIAHTNVLAGAVITATQSHASADNAAWGANNLTDGILTGRGGVNGWTSLGVGQTPNSSSRPIITFNAGTGKSMTFNTVLLYPRTDTLTADGEMAGFPDGFTIEAYVGGTWTSVKTVTGAKAPMYGPYVIELDAPITATQLRITFTKCGTPAADDAKSSTYRVQLCEIAAYNISKIDITTGSLANATEWSAYNATLSSGTTGAKWQVSGGRLPNGLILDTATGVISGKPTEDGTFNLTVTAIAPNATGSKALTLTVAYADNPNLDPEETTAPDSSQTTPEPDVSVTTPDLTVGGGTTAPITTTPTTDKPSSGGCKKKKNSESATMGNSLIAFSPFVLMFGGFVTFRQVRRAKKSKETSEEESE